MEFLKFRKRIAYMFIGFLIIWFSFLFFAALRLDIGKLEAIGLGTATGIFLAAFKDMWFFIWRKR